MSETLNVLVPDFTEISIAERKYKIGKLTTAQTIKLARYLVRFTTKLTSETSKKLAENKSNVEDILTIFDFLNEDEIAGILGILLKEEDTEFIKINLDIEKTTEIIAVICEKTDIKKILGNITRIAEAMKK